jgi:hypothetical protein
MFDLEITIDAALPANIIHISRPPITDAPMHITASRQMDAALLTLLAEPIADAIAEAAEAIEDSPRTRATPS